MSADDSKDGFCEREEPPGVLFRRFSFGQQPPFSRIPSIDVELIQPVQHVWVNVFIVWQVLVDAPMKRDQVVDIGHFPIVRFQYGLESFLDALLRPERSEEVLLECA